MSEDRDEHFLRAVDLMHLPIGVYILAPDGRFFECNEGARKILALTGSEPVGAT